MALLSHPAMKQFGLFNGARMLVLGLFASVAPPVWANDAYHCEFTQECVAGDQPCNSTEIVTMAFVESADGWMIRMPDGKEMGFTALPGTSDEMRSFLSGETDTDANAISILSIFSDGQAFMSTHGIFFSPGTVTHIGTCSPESN